MIDKDLADKVRKLVRQGRAIDVRRLMLQPDQVSLLQLIEHREEMTSTWLAAHQGTSIPAARAKLEKLYDGGYVLRRKKSRACGGREIIYTPLP